MIPETKDQLLTLPDGLSSRGQPFWLNRFLTFVVPITWETAIVEVLALMAVFSRLLALGARVMSHDESLYVYYSWLLATGKGLPTTR